MKRKVIVVAGARPNFIMVAPIMREFRKYKDIFDVVLVHTGQHYDYGMSDVFFEEMQIPHPMKNLNINCLISFSCS